MQLYHLGNSKYARQLAGEGARLFGGRWNQKGAACIYTSGTKSLAILEYIANVRLDEMPPDLSFTTYTIPEKFIKRILLSELPDDWDAIPTSSSSKLFGSSLLMNENNTCFAVPSVVVPDERNFILNPAAATFDQVKILSVEAFSLDHRIKE